MNCEMTYSNIIDQTVALKGKMQKQYQQQQQQLQQQQQQPIQPVSRTYQYRKVMKPMLERKRRARINRCLDELKELMVTALQAEGENVAKLEKADILELTVRHLHKLRRQQRLAANPVIDTDRFRAGFTHAANEVSKCLASTPGVDIKLGTKLMSHLGYRLNDLDKVSPLSIQCGQNIYTPPSSPASSILSPSSQTMMTTASASTTSSSSNDMHYAMPLTPASSRCSQSNTPSPIPIDCTQKHGLLKVVSSITVCQADSVWRPW